MGIIPSLGSGILRLLAPFPLRFLGVVLGIVQVIGAILQRRGLGASSEEIGLELAFFTFELFDFLFQLGDAAQGIAMATLPISGLLTELEVLAFQSARIFGARAPATSWRGSPPRRSTPRRSRWGNRPVPVGHP